MTFFRTRPAGTGPEHCPNCGSARLFTQKAHGKKCDFPVNDDLHGAAYGQIRRYRVLDVIDRAG
jgi:hypothetical protein